MGITVLVRDQSSTGLQSGSLQLEEIAPAITLRDLIRTRVREEVARHNAAPDAALLGLMMPEGAERVPDGFVMRTPVDWQTEADLTVDAFAHNAFFVLVDDRQIVELDEVLDLTADSDIRFVRLVQLAGG